MNTAQKTVVALLFILAGILLWRDLKPQAPIRGFDVATFGQLPVQEGGRLKPLDSVARASLMAIGGKQVYKDPEDKVHSASEWLMELLMDPQAASLHHIFRIDHPQVVALFGESNEDRMFFSFAEIAERYETLVEQFSSVNETPQLRDTYEKALVKLQQAIATYDGLVFSYTTPPIFGGPSRELEIIKRARGDLTSNEPGSETHILASNALDLLANQYARISSSQIMQTVPPVPGSTGWRGLGEAMLDAVQGGEIDSSIPVYAEMSEAWRKNEVLKFNSLIQELQQNLLEFTGKRAPKISFEYFFNNFAPFYYSMEIYLLVLIAAILGWLFWGKAFAFAAFWLMVIAFAVHTFGMIARVYIQERPPVTNLYSSAVFVGWAAVLLCVWMEKMYRNSIAAAAAAMIGFCTLIIAHHLSFSGDTMEVMRAVLDSNFWLATHVPTVTMGYSAAFLAGFLAIVYIIRARLPGGMPLETGRSIERMVYGVVCFALLFSFVGTVLGGIWADQSWGRFWGWDPKENGALMIVLWNALILHARWGKVASTLAIMQLAVVGNIITAWSWFGTNMLGVGLHSYGFMDKAFMWLLAFVISQLVIIAVGWVPDRATLSTAPAHKND